VLELPETVRRKALAAGAIGWVGALPKLIGDLERDWGLEVGRLYDGGTEAFVAEATLEDGTRAVLKLLIPTPGQAQNEITALRLAAGDGCVQLLQADPTRHALLLERLGRALYELALPLSQRLEILCSTAARVWRPAPDCGLPTGADKGRRLIELITSTWQELDHPCSEDAVTYAVACAESRIAAHDDERAVLVHGDVHQWNALEADTGFKLIDPDGLLAEAEYDLGILMREDPRDLLHGDPRARSRMLAEATGLDEIAIWEWGVVERVSTGLLATKVGLQPVGQEMLAVADRVAPPLLPTGHL
jgi:streptomycin 6-kinase